MYILPSPLFNYPSESGRTLVLFSSSSPSPVCHSLQLNHQFDGLSRSLFDEGTGCVSLQSVREVIGEQAHSDLKTGSEQRKLWKTLYK